MGCCRTVVWKQVAKATAARPKAVSSSGGSRSKPFLHLTRELAVTQTISGLKQSPRNAVPGRATSCLAWVRNRALGSCCSVVFRFTAWCTFAYVTTASLMAVGQLGPEEYLRAVVASHMDRAGLRFGSCPSERLAAMPGTSAAIPHVTDLRVRPLDFHCRCSKQVNSKCCCCHGDDLAHAACFDFASEPRVHRGSSRTWLRSRWPTCSQFIRTAGRTCTATSAQRYTVCRRMILAS